MRSVLGFVEDLFRCSFPALMVRHGPLSSVLLFCSPFAQEVAPFKFSLVICLIATEVKALCDTIFTTEGKKNTA